MENFEDERIRALLMDYDAICESRREILPFEDFVELWFVADGIAQVAVAKEFEAPRSEE